MKRKENTSKHRSTTILLIVVCSLVALYASCKKDESHNNNLSVPTLVKQFYPNSGNAGTLVNIVGEGFGTERSNVYVRIADVEAEILSVQDDRIVIRMPEEGKTGKIALKVGDQQFDIGQYTYQSLSLQSIYPTKAQAGTEIRLTGQGFSSVTAQPTVSINGKEATIVFATDEELVAIVPESAGTGEVTVKLGDLASTGPELLFMEISAMKPLTGGTGTKVTLTGSGFEEDITGTTVEFNGLKGVVLSASATELVVRAPAEVSTGGLVVKMAEGNINGPAFTVVPPPLLSSVSPLSGPSGVEMTIEGQYFSANAEETKVFINDIVIPTKTISETSIQLTVPAHVGSGEVKVVVNDQLSLGPRFTSQQLGISKLSPEDGMPGTEVTISGTGFSKIATENVVSIAGLAVPVLSATENELKVVAPVGLTTGKIRISVQGLQAESPKNFVRRGMVVLAGNLNLANVSSTIAADEQGNVYLASAATQQILKINPTGAVSVLAGSGAVGFVDGRGSNAQFNMAAFQGLVFNKHTQTLFVSDGNNKALREITLAGEVKTVYSDYAHNKIEAMTVSANGTLYLSYNQVKAALTFNPFTRSTLNLGVRSLTYSTAQSRKVVLSNGVYLYGNSNNIISLSNLAPGTELAANWFIGSSNTGAVAGLHTWDSNHLIALQPSTRGLRTINVASKQINNLFTWSGSGAVVEGDARKARLGSSIADFTVGINGEIYLLDMTNNAILKIYTK